MKFAHAAATTLIFLLVYLAIYLLHSQFFHVEVVFYSALLDGMLAACLVAAVMFALREKINSFSIFETSLMTVIWLLIAYSIAISVPTVLDRSLSFYILEKLAQRGGGIRYESFEDVFTTEYVSEHRLVDVRLTEQRASGTIVIDDGCVKLTERGKALATFSRFFRKNLLPKKRLLMDEYTDVLTDPFRNGSEESPDYICE